MIARFFQFSLSCVIGCGTFVVLPNDTPKGLLSLFMGVAGLIVLMKAWAWVRYGAESARSVSLSE